MHFVSERRDHPLFAVASASIALALVAFLAFTARAGAAETLYWDNYGDNPDTLAFANIDGSGGGQLSTGTEAVESPEGMAYDTVTNRFFTTTGSGVNRHILAINADGTGASVFSAPGAPVAEPEGVAVDPVSRTIYWGNTKTGEPSIAWAKLDGSAGGVLDTTGATFESPCCRIAIDPTGGRLYWINSASGSIAFANLNNTGGGGTLNLTGSTVKPGGEGITVDSAGGRVYFLGSNKIGFANVNGSGGGDLSLGGGVINGPYGLAFDPAFNRVYWGNESNNEIRTDAFGFVNVGGSGGSITVTTAPIANPQDPVILKSPAPAGAPTITRDAKSRSSLTCSSGSWGADTPGGFVYQAPRAFAYQWAVNGSVLGSGPETIGATKAGSYTCTVTATNQTGSATQSAAAVTVKPTKVKLSTKKKGKGKPGQLVSFKVKAVNQGDISTRSSTKLCVKLPKAAKDDLKAPKCKKLGTLKGRAKKTLTLKVKVKPGADEGTAKLTFQVKGSAGKAAKSKIIVK